MASALTKKALREDDRQEKLLADAIRASEALDPVRRRSLYRHVEKRIEADVAGTTNPAQTTESTSKQSRGNGEGSYADAAEDYVLAHKKGATTREVADAIGQNYGSADGTLRHISKKRRTIERRDDKWFPTTNAKRVGRERPTTIGDAIKLVFAKNGNQPLAAKDIFKGVKATLPDAKKGSVDAQLVGMRKDDVLVQKGDAPHGGGLYHLADFGGAHAVSAN